MFLLRGIWNATRALVKKGAVNACAGPDPLGICDATLELDAEAGDCYSAGAGKIVSVGPNWAHIQVANERVILMYEGLAPTVKLGQHVGRGQKLGTVDGPLSFGVWQIDDAGELAAVEPASWLVARGFRIAGKLAGKGDLWCEQGRHLTVPKTAHVQCGLENPESAGFALLPVTIDQE